jgi:hypothetical protein
MEIVGEPEKNEQEYDLMLEFIRDNPEYTDEELRSFLEDLAIIRDDLDPDKMSKSVTKHSKRMSSAIAAAMSVVMEKNNWEEQERDERGRFGSGNGGGSNKPSSGRGGSNKPSSGRGGKKPEDKPKKNPIGNLEYEALTHELGMPTDMVDEFIAENPEASFEDAVAHFYDLGSIQDYEIARIVNEERGNSLDTATYEALAERLGVDLNATEDGAYGNSEDGTSDINSSEDKPLYDYDAIAEHTIDFDDDATNEAMHTIAADIIDEYLAENPDSRLDFETELPLIMENLRNEFDGQTNVTPEDVANLVNENLQSFEETMASNASSIWDDNEDSSNTPADIEAFREGLHDIQVPENTISGYDENRAFTVLEDDNNKLIPIADYSDDKIDEVANNIAYQAVYNVANNRDFEENFISDADIRDPSYWDVAEAVDSGGHGRLSQVADYIRENSPDDDFTSELANIITSSGPSTFTTWQDYYDELRADLKQQLEELRAEALAAQKPPKKSFEDLRTKLAVMKAKQLLKDI